MSLFKLRRALVKRVCLRLHCTSYLAEIKITFIDFGLKINWVLEYGVI